MKRITATIECVISYNSNYDESYQTIEDNVFNDLSSSLKEIDIRLDEFKLISSRKTY